MRVIRGFPEEGIVACFEEAPGGGDIKDINSLCNAPAKDPAGNLSAVYWHSDFFQYELALPLQTRTITHAALAGYSQYYQITSVVTPVGSAPTDGISFRRVGQSRATDIALVTHNLGYVPLFFVSFGGRVITNGSIVQVAGNGLTRWVSPYATSSIIGLREFAVSTTSALPAINCTYQALLFRNTEAQQGRPLFGLEGDNLVVGKGKVDTSKQYLRAALAGETDFDFDTGRTIDIRNGRSRHVSGGITTTESGYNGGFGGSGFVPMGV
ncbi:hypothetical protein XM25_07770 [Devosia sp. H5989]|nr:hypothetical protein XM25_07770 [Devosia sp. H5989]